VLFPGCRHKAAQKKTRASELLLNSCAYILHIWRFCFSFSFVCIHSAAVRLDVSLFVSTYQASFSLHSPSRQRYTSEPAAMVCHVSSPHPLRVHYNTPAQDNPACNGRGGNR